jgi:hypothetical protein
MIRTIVRASFLLIICAGVISCGTDTRSLIEGRVADGIADKAFNSSSNNSDDKTSDSGIKKSQKKFSGSSTGDGHHIDSDIIYISKEPFKGSGWIYVKTAKTVTPASAKTKNEGLYMTTSDGDEIWTKHFWKTRIASEKELKTGLIVIAFERSEDDVYVSPENKSQAISDNWFMAKITDMSDRHKGYVTVSGGYKISLENIRIAVK